MNPSTNTITHTVELIGSFTAAHVESGISIDLTHRRNRRTTKGPISPLCRKLIEVGHGREDRVHIVRKQVGGNGFMPIFKRDRTLAAWADADCVERERSSVRVLKYRPLPDAVKAI